MIYDYLIIGGGISGVSMARLLQLSGVESICLLEAGSEAGGLCRTRRIGPHVLDTGGGHFLCTKFPEVQNFIFRHLPRTEFNVFQRVSRIVIDGCEVDFPLESNLWQLPSSLCAEYLISVVQNGEARGLPPPDHFESWIRWKLGDLIAERYMLPYNRKIWGVPASEMDIDWLHKIPRIDVRRIVEACLNREFGREYMPSHAEFYYPASGGFQQVFDAIAKPVDKFVLTDCPVTTIERENPGGVLCVNGRFRARTIINTAPWPTLIRSPIFNEEARQAIGRLRHTQLVVSLHEDAYETDTHWLYEPDEQLPRHRSFFIHNFAPRSAANGIFRETNLQRWQAGQGEIHAEINPFAYPVPSRGWAASVMTVLNHLRPFGVHGLGRWGQWQYFNADVCIWEAMHLADELGHPQWRAGMQSQSSPILSV
ncbi:NAD(P)-binding protein [Termitidicoccus mucosus]|uniref:Amine oxidase domain-containing protein n=1 Tax=Termitidicoccus mucosus TaxID=1184151 RepID=A0A178IHE2_9BACT|nr:hypothetical protein AW736_16205 [Opitutaceae bacterium TSB47]